MYRKNHGVFAVITHSYRPKPYSNEVEARERCEFVDRIKYRHLREATAIIDIKNMETIKNRVGEKATFDKYISHIEESYPKEFKDLLTYTDLEKQYSKLKNKADESK